MVGRMLSRIGLCWLLAAGCSESSGPLAPCTAAAPLVDLTAGEYRSADPRPSGDFVLRAVRGAGCVAFAANPSGSDMEYLLVPQAATGTPGSKSSFWLRGATVAALAAPAARVAPSVQLAPAARFHEFLRESEQQLYLNNPPTIHPFTAPRFALAPPAVGDVGTFSVCSNLDCTSKTTVTATAKQVGVHIAIFEDNNKPSGGLSDADFLSLRYKFDTLLYVRDTLAFGRESDIDQNGVVIVLMTNAVNQLVSATECSTTGFVAGYFYGADLIFGQGNNGEIFYSIVADPAPASLMSCPHSVTQVNSLVPVTFIHEFQHMISFGQHYLRRAGAPEVLWLNEGLSHFAEEMGGRRYLPDTATFCDFVNGDLHNAGQYFSAPQDHYLLATEGIGTLAEPGAMRLLGRYLLDPYAADQSLTARDVVTRRIDQTTLTGAANVEHVTGRPVAETATHWALANYVSDLPRFTPPPELQYKVRKFRTDYPTLSARCPVPNNIPATFPLVPPVGPGSVVNVSDTLRAGSGKYFRAQQSAGAIGFTLLFSDGQGFALPDALVPRLNVIRIK